jgi:hypothetical protein
MSPVWPCEKPVSLRRDAPNSKLQTLQHSHLTHLPFLHFQEAGSTAYSSVHRGNLSTPTSCQCCHTASYTFFIADPDICSHTRDFATVKHGHATRAISPTRVLITKVNSKPPEKPVITPQEIPNEATTRLVSEIPKGLRSHTTTPASRYCNIRGAGACGTSDI